MQKLIIKDAGSDTIIAEADMDTVVNHDGNYYVSTDHVNMETLEITERTGVSREKGLYHWIDLVNGSVRLEGVAWVYPDPSDAYIAIKGRVGFYKRGFRGTIVEVVDTVGQN